MQKTRDLSIGAGTHSEVVKRILDHGIVVSGASVFSGDGGEKDVFDRIAVAKWEANWREFCTRLFETEAFRLIYTPDFDMRPVVEFAERMALGTFRAILHPDFDEMIRNKCLEESGKLCCEVFLKRSALDTDTDKSALMR